MVLRTILFPLILVLTMCVKTIYISKKGRCLAVGLLNVEHLVLKFLNRAWEELDSDLFPVRNSKLVWNCSEYRVD